MNFDGHFQNAYVTRNCAKAIALLKARYGVTKVVEFDVDIDMDTAKGRGRVKSKVALCWSGNLQIELIEPISGLVDIYTEYLPKDDSLRFHHICLRIDDFEATRAEIVKLGWPIALEGAVEGIKYVYVDRREDLGHYVEYLWASPEMWAYTGPP